MAAGRHMGMVWDHGVIICPYLAQQLHQTEYREAEEETQIPSDVSQEVAPGVQHVVGIDFQVIRKLQT